LPRLGYVTSEDGKTFALRRVTSTIEFTLVIRHGRACHGHPRITHRAIFKKDVEGDS